MFQLSSISSSRLVYFALGVASTLVIQSLVLGIGSARNDEDPLSTPNSPSKVGKSPEPSRITSPLKQVDTVVEHNTEGTPTGDECQCVDQSVPIAELALGLQPSFSSEQRDHEWAYFAEQSITQYLVSHPLFAAYELENIECRSLTCQIRVKAYDARAGADWQVIMYELRQEEWVEFDQYGNSTGEVDGVFSIVETIRRSESKR